MRRILRVIGILVALLLVALVCLPLLVSANRFKPLLESKLSAALGRQVTIGDLGLSLLRGGLTADGLSIADDPAFSTAPFLEAKSLKVGVKLWPLIASRKLIVTKLTIDRPQVTLLQSPAGRWNYSSLGGKSAPAPPPDQGVSGEGGLDLSAKVVNVAGGRFSMGKTGGRQKPLVLDDVNIEVRDFSPSSPFAFSMSAEVAGGGNIKMAGQAGPIDAADVALTPLTLTLDIARLNLAAVLAGTAPDLAGTASLKASGNSASGRLTLNGKLRAEGLKLAKNGAPARRPVEFDFATQYDLGRHAGALQRGIIRVGSASANLSGTYAERGDSMALDMKLAGTKMPVPELAELLPPLGIALPGGSKLENGTATLAFTAAGPADRLVADGAVSLDKVRLANFNLGSKMQMIQQLAGIKSGPNTDIETFHAKVKRTAAGTIVDELRFVAQGVGELNGAGTISPANALDFRMNATVETARSAVLSRTAVPFFVQGTATNPVFKPDVQGLAKAGAKTLLQSEAQKRLKGNAGEAVSGVLDSLFGAKKKKQ